MATTRRTMIATTAAAFAPALPAIAQVRTIRYADTSALPTSWPVYIADAKGYFRDEGLSLETTYTNSNPAVAQQVVAGNFDLGITTYETAVRAVMGDAPLKITASVMRAFPYMIMAKQGVKSAQDMKGKTVVLPLVKSLITVFWNRWLLENGMQVSDVDQIYDAATPNRYLSLKSGAAQASVLGQPFDWIAEADGFTKLLDLGARVRDFGFTAVVARTDWLAKNGPVMKGFLRALSRTVPFFYDPANREECAQILMPPTKLDKENALKSWDYYVKDLKPFDKSLDLPPKQLDLLIGTLIELGDLKAGGDYKYGRFVDPSFLPGA